jgi:hypothetical protein
LFVGSVCALLGTAQVVLPATLADLRKWLTPAGYYFETADDIWTTPKEDEQVDRGVALRRPGYASSSDAGSRMRVEVALQPDARPGMATAKQGEVLVYPKLTPPYHHEPGALLNLDSKTVTASIDTEVAGKVSSEPLFLELFFESCDSTGARERLSDRQWTADIVAAGHLDIKAHPSGPRATRICAIGIKMGMKDADPYAYEGVLFVNSVTW